MLLTVSLSTGLGPILRRRADFGYFPLALVERALPRYQAPQRND
jgi:hypothetical protein